MPDPLAGIDVLLCVAVFPLTRPMLESAPRLRAIVSAVTGVDGVDLGAATERAVVVANAQTEENIIGMGEATVLLMLAALYDLDGAQTRVRQNLWRPPQLPASQLRGKTVGLIGLGKIGRETARLLAPFGAKLQYSARRDADLAGLPPMPRVDLDTLLRTSDIVLVLASLNPETRGLINADNLKLMKPTAILINTARGAIIDEAALAAALRNRHDCPRRARLLHRRAAAGRQPAARPAERDPDAAHDRPHHRGASFARSREPRESRSDPGRQAAALRGQSCGAAGLDGEMVPGLVARRNRLDRRRVAENRLAAVLDPVLSAAAVLAGAFQHPVGKGDLACGRNLRPMLLHAIAEASAAGLHARAQGLQVGLAGTVGMAGLGQRNAGDDHGSGKSEHAEATHRASSCWLAVTMPLAVETTVSK